MLPFVSYENMEAFIFALSQTNVGNSKGYKFKTTLPNIAKALCLVNTIRDQLLYVAEKSSKQLVVKYLQCKYDWECWGDMSITTDISYAYPRCHSPSTTHWLGRYWSRKDQHSHQFVHHACCRQLCKHFKKTNIAFAEFYIRWWNFQSRDFKQLSLLNLIKKNLWKTRDPI